MVNNDSAFVRTHRGKITCYTNKTVLTLLVPKGSVSEMSKDTGWGAEVGEGAGGGEKGGKGGGVAPHDPAQDLLLSAAHGGWGPCCAPGRQGLQQVKGWLHWWQGPWMAGHAWWQVGQPAWGLPQWVEWWRQVEARPSSSIGEALNKTYCKILKIDQVGLEENLDTTHKHGEGCGEERR